MNQRIKETIGQLLADAMDKAVANGANSVSMPDEYVELAAWLSADTASPDANVERNRRMLLDRSVVGLKKYGVTTERDDLSLGQWVQHTIEEVLDLANYLQALKTNLERAEVTIVRNSAGQIYLQYADGKTLIDYPVGARFALLPPDEDFDGLVSALEDEAFK